MDSLSMMELFSVLPVAKRNTSLSLDTRLSQWFRTLVSMGKSVASFVRNIVVSHKALWGSDVWRAWDRLPFDQKLVWFLVINHTVAILTIAEILFLRK